jgi:flagellar biosynthesis protein FlhF
MYVKKFEGETLDEVLKSVKRELGPDAIILKTITNKGLKGAFKKSRIEITAAISEQNYAKKAKVDKVLSQDQKEQFYSEPAAEINKSLNQYSKNKPSISGGYGSMGLNKVVNSVAKASSKIKNNLDDFLAATEAPKTISSSHHEEYEEEDQSNIINEYYIEQSRETAVEEEKPFRNLATVSAASSEIALELRQQLKTQQNQIEMLERKLFELTQNMTVQETHHGESKGIIDLRTTLKTLDLSDRIVSDIIKKAKFELSRDDLEDADVVYDFALREINNLVTVAMPLFSSANVQDKPVVTVLLSETACGQSSMALKLAVLQEGVRIIRFRQADREAANVQFTSQVFNLDIVNVDSLSHLMSEARKAIADNKSIIMDIKTFAQDKDESRKIIDTLKRSFEHIEFLVTVSAINSEMYNRKILSKYKDFASGVIISYMDQCLSFGSILNLHYAYSNIPLKFFGTGATVPDDIEAATSERILAGMFEL